MSDSPTTSVSPTQISARDLMRRSLLTDLDARIEAAGGHADYIYTTPGPDLDRMRRRVAIVLEEASALPGEPDAAHDATDRLLAITSMLETEAACRDLVAENAVDETGATAYEIPDEIHAITQHNLAVRVAYHDVKLADPGYRHRMGFDHLQASVPYRKHLVAQQLDAYRRGLDIEPSRQTQSQLGKKIHDHLTAWALDPHRAELPGVVATAPPGSIAIPEAVLAPGADPYAIDEPAPSWPEPWVPEPELGPAGTLLPQVAEHLTEQSEYVQRAVDEYRQLRHDVAAATNQGVYPDYLPESQEREWDAAARVVDDATANALWRASALDTPTATPHAALEHGREKRPARPARDAYLDARAQVGAVGMALADPAMRRALILARLRRDQARIAGSLPAGYDPDRKPPFWRAQARSEWQRHQKTARALAANAEWQGQIRTELGPNSEKITRRALALADAREQLLGRTPELQRDAIDEELAREPEWLTETLGRRPDIGAGRWDVLAGQVAANRLRFLVCDDADPGIRPEQTHLAQQVEQFQIDTHLTEAMTLTPKVAVGVGMGM